MYPSGDRCKVKLNICNTVRKTIIIKFGSHFILALSFLTYYVGYFR